jgi:zinc transporter 13
MQKFVISILINYKPHFLLAEARTSWILPFTAGGFLHIALVTVLPDLLQEENPKESLLHLVSLLAGIGVMAALIVIGE